MGPWGRCDIAPLQTIYGIIERMWGQVTGSLHWFVTVTEQTYNRQSRKTALFLKDFETIWCTTWQPFALLCSGHKTCFGILLLPMASQHPPVTFYTDWIHTKTGFRLRIILNCYRDTSYAKMLANTGIFFSTAETQYTGKNIFFRSILRPDSCLSRLLSPPRDKEILSTTACRTKKVPVVHKLCLGKLQ